MTKAIVRPFILSLIVLAIACGGRGGHGQETLVVAWETSPTSLDPRYETDAKSSQLNRFVFQSLAELDERFLYRPNLAERWEQPDPLTYVFTLKKTGRFHDGNPVTAHDVKATFDWILDPANASPKRGMLDRIREVQAPNPHTVVFRLSEPFAPFLEASLVKIVRQSSLKEPVGSGPYRLVAFRRDEEIVIERIKEPSGDQPSVKRMIFRVIPDSLTRSLELKKGTVDFVQNEIDPDTVPWLERRGIARVQTVPGSIIQYLGMQYEDRILGRTEVRRAIALALDRTRMIRHLLRGYATEATGLLFPGHWAYEGDVDRYPYDPERAKRLLDHAGFPDPDGDGPEPRFRLTYKTSTLDLRRRIAEAIQEQLKVVGIAVEIRSYEFATLYADVKKGNFQLYSMDWVGINDPDVYFNLFHSKSIAPLGNNRGRYRHPLMDSLTEKGRRETDLDARRSIYARVQRLAAEELPLIPLWWFTNVAMMRKQVHGFAPHPSGDLFSLTRVWKQ